MHTSHLKTILQTLLAALFLSTTFAQVSAIAYPVEDISIDGSLKEWPDELPWYIVDNKYGPDNETREDFAARFCVGYNEVEKALYLGVVVIDDEHIGANGESHMTQDHALVYLDRYHQNKGGAPFFYVGAEKHLELVKKHPFWDPHHADVSLDNAKVAVKHQGNQTFYEWKIRLGDKIKANTVLGLDHFIIDQDPNQPNQLNVLWKDGFQKSSGSQRLGDVMLLQSNASVGSIEGNLKLPEEVRIDEFSLRGVENPDFWIKVRVDSTGYFKAVLPQGPYLIEPNRWYSSPIYSVGFKQNTRKLQYELPQSISVVANQNTTLDTINVEVKPHPKTQGSEMLFGDGKDLARSTDEFIKTWMDYLNIPAVSVALIQNNKLVYDKNFGYKNLATAELTDQNTLFEAASISKSVFAVMVLRLAERGIIDLNKPLYEYLPFPNLEGDERYKLLTARIVLNHQSGLPNWAWGGPGTWESGGPISLNFKPGTAFGYSGEAFNYLGRVLEQITQKKLPQIFKEEVAGPFKLKNTFYNYADSQEKNTAMGHYQQYPSYKGKEYMPSPASSVVTNAHDFQRFVIGLLKEKHLSKRSYELLYTPQTVLEADQKIYDPDTPQYISHGFFVQETAKGKLLAHGGNNGDYDCKFAYNPQQKVGYIVLTNSNLGDEFSRMLEEFLFH
ncbi:serine hydrolase domain-containing protein [Poritiphilus flavus]|uniref:Serine hydrolase n=1 Tax=Poritiphilus flavus TaxID=2697053 RepID=A0A6L9EH82_9FLAO|nr:serine hydrolase domain-containing protein [Poritiphilus flavus]NAS14150.1 serine hydrolase [Poritiphilus flavus]